MRREASPSGPARLNGGQERWATTRLLWVPRNVCTRCWLTVAKEDICR